MKKFLPLLCLIFCVQTIGAAITAPDLSGAWKLVITKSEFKECLGTNEIVFVQSPFTTKSGNTLYMVQGSICNRHYWGASIEEAEDKLHVVWYEIQNKTWDAESNMILSSTENSLSLGGDFEEYEVATMTKINE